MATRRPSWYAFVYGSWCQDMTSGVGPFCTASEAAAASSRLDLRIAPPSKPIRRGVFMACEVGPTPEAFSVFLGPYESRAEAQADIDHDQRGGGAIFSMTPGAQFVGEVRYYRPCKSGVWRVLVKRDQPAQTLVTR